MDLTVNPGRAIIGVVALPGDKSISHRAALFAALAPGSSTIDNFLDAGVTRVMLDALEALGVCCQLSSGPDGRTPRLVVKGPGLRHWTAPAGPLDCGHSGTTIRFLAGAVSAAGIPAVLDGSAGLRKRPMDRIVDPLRQMAVPVQAAAGGAAPLRFEERPVGQPLRAVHYALPVASAQVKTALMLAALDADGPVVLSEPGRSRDHTERLLAAMGARIAVRDHHGPAGHRAVTVHPLDEPLAPIEIKVPGDFSSAAFLIVAALITPGSEITLPGIGVNPTRTGLLDVLRAMGGQIQIERERTIGGEPVADIHVWASRLQATEISGDLVVRMIDEFPIFGVAAAYADGTSVVSGAAELRLKESDRITGLVAGLRQLGVRAEERSDGFVVSGAEPHGGGIVDARGDHRMAMAWVVAGLAGTQPVTVRGAEIIDQSYPGFSSALRELGASLSPT